MRNIKFLVAALICLSAFSICSNNMEEAAATSTNYCTVPYNVSYDSIVNNSTYLLCQATAYNSQYEVLNGTATSAKQIPFSGTSYTSWTSLKTDATNRGSSYVTLIKRSNNDWYIRRNYDGKYLCADSNSDLTFASSTTASGYYTYFTAQEGSDSSFVKFLNCKDSSLYLGTKSAGSYFDTWHDQAGSVAEKNFALFSVFTSYSDAANYYGSIFVSNMESVCSSAGDTNITSLSTKWNEMSTLWGYLSSDVKSSIAGTSGDISGSYTQQCIAKYLFICQKYNSLYPAITNFMNITVSPSNKSVLYNNSFGNVLIVSLLVSSLSFAGFYYIFKRKHNK